MHAKKKPAVHAHEKQPPNKVKCMRLSPKNQDGSQKKNHLEAVKPLFSLTRPECMARMCLFLSQMLKEDPQSYSASAEELF